MTAAAVVAAATVVACGGPESAVGAGQRPPSDSTAAATVSWSDIAALPVARADARVAYGPDSARQFGALRLPSGAGPFPVAVVLHGGCWLNQYGLDQISQPALALAGAGVATWTIEYRRVGDPGGGWPGTFADVARGIDAVRTLAARYPLDTTRVVVVGHSSGGHLALWAAARSPLGADAPPDAPSGPTLRVRGVVALAGITDLADYYANGSGCGASIADLLGASPAQVPVRVRAASPVARLPLGVPVRLVYGTADAVVPPAQSTAFAARAAAAGDSVVLQPIARAGHYDVIYPSGVPWATVVEAVRGVIPPPNASARAARVVRAGQFRRPAAG